MIGVGRDNDNDDPLAGPAIASARRTLETTTLLLQRLEADELAQLDATAIVPWRFIVRIEVGLTLTCGLLALAGLLTARAVPGDHSMSTLLFILAAVVFVLAMGVACLHPHGRRRCRDGGGHVFVK